MTDVKKQYKVTPKYQSAVTSLIRKECCNYMWNSCVYLDCVCPQIGHATLCCKWFREAVLPLNKELQAALMNLDVMKDCSVCHKQYVPNSNRSKYCDDCGIKVRRKQILNRVHKLRG